MRKRGVDSADACASRRRTFLRDAPPLVVAEILAPALAPTLVGRSPVLALILLLLPLPILCVLTWRLFRAACPWCGRSFFLRTHRSATPAGRYLVFSTLVEYPLRCANCSVTLED